MVFRYLNYCSIVSIFLCLCCVSAFHTSHHIHNGITVLCTQNAYPCGHTHAYFEHEGIWQTPGLLSDCQSATSHKQHAELMPLCKRSSDFHLPDINIGCHDVCTFVPFLSTYCISFKYWRYSSVFIALVIFAPAISMYFSTDLKIDSIGPILTTALQCMLQGPCAHWY